ncbi:cuticle protein 16.5-like [Trichoplusia ni]|uniref:Cuticle protein 16.5-like n=1 Tax=Trichoplusia ni TaxID=7111 RepID=A0A7E5VSW7_TRINI|nr:cuticle protein 16.5-like [Trichoplusia ni]
MYKLLSFLVILAVAFAAPAPEPGAIIPGPALYKAPLAYGPAIGYAAIPAAPAIQYNAPYYAAYPAAQLPYGRIY